MIDNFQAFFLDPENIHRPSVRYWLPDASISTDVLKDDIKNLAQVGIGGFELVPFYLYGLPAGGQTPTDWNKYGYGTPAYKKVFDAAVEAAKDQQILMSFSLGANQGQGAPAKMESKGLAKELAYSSIVVPSGSNFSGILPRPVDHPISELGIASFMHTTVERIEQKLIAVIAARIERVTESSYFIASANFSVPANDTYLEERSLIDITSKSGDWQIMAFYERYTNQKSCSGDLHPDSIIGNGSWIVDHFSDTGAKVTTDFIDHNVLDNDNQKILATFGQYAWEDSMEMIAAAWWTPEFLSEFKARRGYDLTKYLPFLYNGENTWGQAIPPYLNRTLLGVGTDGGQSVNDDYRATLNELHQKYLGHMQDWSHSKGLKFSNQPAYNLPLDMAADISLIDTPETESLGFPTLDQLRQFTGPAHISNKNIISSETGALTVRASGYSQTIPELLATVQLQLIAGVNEFVLHGTPYSGDYAGTTWPGYTPFYYAVTEMHSRCQPAWGTYKSSMDYIARNSMVSQLGTAKIDLAFLTSASAFKFPILNTSMLTGYGYSYEYIGPANLNLKDSIVQNQILAPNGPAFKALFIDGTGSLPYETISRLEYYAKQDLPIVFLKSIPTKCLPATCSTIAFQTRLSNLVAIYPKTVKISNSLDDLSQTLSTIGVKPRVAFTGDSWFHTMWKSDTVSSADYLYFWNPNPITKSQFIVEFAETRYPFKLDAWTGTFSPIVEYTRDKSSISMSMTLNGNASTIIVFSKDKTFYGEISPSLSVMDSSRNTLAFSSTNGSITAQAVGNSTITLSNGKIVKIQAQAPLASTLETWNITIADWHPTSNLSSTDTEISNHTIVNTNLMPWTKYNLSDVSGIGYYTTFFDLVSLDAKLSLGPIQHTVKVILNNRELPPIDLFNPVIDISSYSKIGRNQLQIHITTTLFNAVKSRSSKIMTAGVPAALSNAALAENATSKEYGLLGPVVVTPYKAVKVA
ncbi:hypothetical protein BGZ60DRAFT_554003 [Tricladium varicosporioides]|nr:hypothetical protein BGZ60DRAFT_554003 [Hymenoscyphus varicosporioides]